MREFEDKIKSLYNRNGIDLYNIKFQFFLTPKLHKIIYAFRNITCGCTSYSDRSGKMLHKLLQYYINEIKD